MTRPPDKTVQGGDHLGVQKGRTVGEHLHRDAQTQPAGDSCKVGEKGEGLIDVVLRRKLGNARGATHITGLRLHRKSDMVAHEQTIVASLFYALGIGLDGLRVRNAS